jgi:hypothetical protein
VGCGFLRWLVGWVVVMEGWKAIAFSFLAMFGRGKLSLSYLKRFARYGQRELFSGWKGKLGCGVLFLFVYNVVLCIIICYV